MTFAVPAPGGPITPTAPSCRSIGRGTLAATRRTSSGTPTVPTVSCRCPLNYGITRAPGNERRKPPAGPTYARSRSADRDARRLQRGVDMGGVIGARAVLLDLFETLFTEYRHSAPPRWGVASRELGLDSSAFRRVWTDLKDRRMTTELSYRDTLRLVCEELGHEPPLSVISDLDAVRCRDKAACLSGARRGSHRRTQGLAVLGRPASDCLQLQRGRSHRLPGIRPCAARRRRGLVICGRQGEARPGDLRVGLRAPRRRSPRLSLRR